MTEAVTKAAHRRLMFWVGLLYFSEGLPLGVFFDLKTAVLNAVDHLPQRWDGDHVGQAVSEIRARNIGLYGGSYTVLWRGDWHYDYDGREWKLVEQQTGTLEKPLPITRA